MTPLADRELQTADALKALREDLNALGGRVEALIGAVGALAQRLEYVVSAVAERNGHPAEELQHLVTRAVDAVRARRPVLLIVEDDPVTLRAYDRIFGRSAETFTARTVAEATLVVRALGAKIDIALVDYYLPDGQGTRVVEALRRVDGGKLVEVIALSGDDDPRVRDAFIRAGADSFVPKEDAIDSVRERLTKEV